MSLFLLYSKTKSIITWSFDNIWQAMWKVELSLSFWGVQKQSLCLPCMAGAVNSLQWLQKTRLRQVLCITSMALGPSTAILSRWDEEEPFWMIQMSLSGVITPGLTSTLWLQTSIIPYMCDKYKHTDNCSKTPVVSRLWWTILLFVGISGFGFCSLVFLRVKLS